MGCPKYCDRNADDYNITCVDINPKDTRVIKADVLEYLMYLDKTYEHIYSKNLLEHLPNVGTFLFYCHAALKIGGTIDIITDNAEFVPFYWPLGWILHTGIGAHAQNGYALAHCDSIHYGIFTKMHLRNLLENAGFHDVRVRRTWLGARLEARAIS